MQQLIKSTFEKWQSVKKYAAERCRHANMLDVAQQLDNCRMLTGEETLPELIEKMFEPQGYEFMLANSFPSLSNFRKFKKYNPEQYGVYIDCGDIELTDPGNVFLIGHTFANIQCLRTQRNKIIMMHGASLNLIAAGYSVTHIEADRKSRVNTSATKYAKIL